MTVNSIYPILLCEDIKHSFGFKSLRINSNSTFSSLLMLGKWSMIGMPEEIALDGNVLGMSGEMPSILLENSIFIFGDWCSRGRQNAGEMTGECLGRNIHEKCPRTSANIVHATLEYNYGTFYSDCIQYIVVIGIWYQGVINSWILLFSRIPNYQ